MRALWALEKATVQEIRSGLLPDRPLAYTTVMTVMNRLAGKGMVEREKHGRAHLYRPAVRQEIIREHALNQFVENFFQGSREGLRQELELGGIAAREAHAKGATRVDQGKGENVRPDKATRADPGIDTSLL